MNDTALQCLAPHLNNITEHTLWYADENALALCDSITPNPLLTVITNRFDIFQTLQAKNISAVFSDFDTTEYELEKPPQKILYRVSKEKPLVHFLINQAKELLATDGSLVFSGLKNEGIKTYGDKINKVLGVTGKLKKHGIAYCGDFQFTTKNKTKLDDQHYATIKKIKAPQLQTEFFYSKPGVFGWDKIDQGTTLLLEALDSLKDNLGNVCDKTVLDLGCGYGWVGLSIDKFGFKQIIATDNNAAALLCAEKNTNLMQSSMDIIASNCADTVNTKVDLVLCNPPFHRGFQHHQDLTLLFLKRASERLKPNGTALFVVNSFIDIEESGKQFFNTIDTIKKSNSFKVLTLS